MIDMRAVFIIAQKEIRDARRNRWYVLFAFSFAGLSLALAWLALSGSGNSGLAGFGRTGASMVNLVLLIVPLMGLSIGALSLSGEIESGSMLYLLSQPVSQFEVVLGKYLGAGLALLAALVFGFGVSGVAIGWQDGMTGSGAYLWLVLFAFLLALVSLSLGFLISAAAKKSATAIGIAIFVWLVLVFFGDLGLMGTAIVLKLRVSELFTLAVLNPLQIFKIASILQIRSSMEVLGPAGIYALRTYGNGLLPLLLLLLMAWIVLPMGITQFIFKKVGGVS